MERTRVAGIIFMDGGIALMHRVGVLKRKDIQEYYTFPGGGLEEGETLKQGLMRELKEEIGFEGTFEPIITHYTDEITENKNCFIHEIEIDFVIPVEKEKVQVKLSDEHIDFKWVKKDSSLLDDFIRAKLTNL